MWMGSEELGDATEHGSSISLADYVLKPSELVEQR